jgi:hypothetical protein
MFPVVFDISTLFHRHALGEVARLIDVETLHMACQVMKDYYYDACFNTPVSNKITTIKPNPNSTKPTFEPIDDIVAFSDLAIALSTIPTIIAAIAAGVI